MKAGTIAQKKGNSTNRAPTCHRNPCSACRNSLRYRQDDGKCTINRPLLKNPDLLQPRALGALRLSSKIVEGRTLLNALRHSGATKAFFPSVKPHLEAVILNSAGGITGGDRFTFEAHAGTGSHLVLTTQAAERAYRALPDEKGQMSTRLSVANSARLDWLPQELILFDGCALDRRLDVELDKEARFLMVESMIFGRRAMGEYLTDVRFDDRIRIRRNGRLIYADGANLTGDVSRTLSRAALAGGAGAMASLVYSAPDAANHLAHIRANLPKLAGATLLMGDLLVLRALARDGFDLRRTLLPILDRLTSHRLPRCWRL